VDAEGAQQYTINHSQFIHILPGARKSRTVYLQCVCNMFALRLACLCHAFAMSSACLCQAICIANVFTMSVGGHVLGMFLSCQCHRCYIIDSQAFAPCFS